MKASFLAALVAVVIAGQASAQTSTYFTPAAPSCATGQCPRVSAAVSQVRSAASEGIHRVGDLVAPSTAVAGYWADPTVTPWHPPLPTAAPVRMIERKECKRQERQERQPIFPRLHHFVTGK